MDIGYQSNSVEELISDMQLFMHQRGSEKYGEFLRSLKKTSLLMSLLGLPNKGERTELFKLIYFSLRLVDDIIDGDTPNKIPLSERKSFIEKIFTGKSGVVLYDNMSSDIQDVSSKIGYDREINKGIEMILQSMKFDIDRIIDSSGLRSQADLDENFHKMDILGTIGLSANIFGLDVDSTIVKLQPLGEACRIAYTLEDLQSDVLQGLYNIPIEDVEKYKITLEELEQIKRGQYSIHVIEWIQIQKEKIKLLLGLYEENEQESIYKSYFSESFFLGRILDAWTTIVMKKIVMPKVYLDDIARIKQLPHLNFR